HALPVGLLLRCGVLPQTRGVTQERLTAAARAGSLQALEEQKAGHRLGERPVPVERHAAVGEQVIAWLLMNDQVEDRAEIPAEDLAPGRRVLHQGLALQRSEAAQDQNALPPGQVAKEFDREVVETGRSAGLARTVRFHHLAERMERPRREGDAIHSWA